MTRKEQFIEDAKTSIEAGCAKVILGIRMPEHTKEIIINDDVANKVAYVRTKYDDDLAMNGFPQIVIEEYLFIKK